MSEDRNSLRAMASDEEGDENLGFWEEDEND